MSTMKAKINGVSQADMNSITTLQWRLTDLNKNSVEVYAIDGSLETLVFAGYILNAFGDYRGMPDVYLNIQANATYYPQMQPVQPFSIPGSVSAPVPMAKIADGLGLAFENNNVNSILTDIYYANNLKERACMLARDGNFDLYIDDKTLAITNKNEGRAGLVPLISSQTGLIGYPTFDAQGVNFSTLFNPSIQFGGKIELDTTLPRAKGTWIVQSMQHILESEKPGGQWMSSIRATLGNFVVNRQ